MGIWSVLSEDQKKRLMLIVGIVAGSLDDPTWFHPQMDLFTSDAEPWDQMDPAIPKYEKYSPMA